jgi:pimeloyl-ACP methyl ester carboxylesterase
MSAIIVDDEVVHYEVLGRGRPLIFVHGWLGSWRYWIPTMQALSGEFRTYALDLWGFGDSGKQRERYSLDAQAELLRGFMDRLAVLKAAFVGHGLGGAVIAHFACKYPDLADRAMAVSVPLTGTAINARLLGTPIPVLIEAFLGKGPTVDPISREAAKTDIAAVETSVKSLMEVDLRAKIAELPMPYLLVYGEKDTVITPPPLGGANGGVDQFTNNVHRVDLEESRHFPMLDEAAKFNRLLVDFLSLKSGEDLHNLELKEEWKRRVR